MLLVLRVVISLAVVLGLFWMVARTGSRKLGGRDRAMLRVRGRQALTRGSSVAVVEVGNRVLVVGVSEGGVRLLTELDPEDLETDEVYETDDVYEDEAGDQDPPVLAPVAAPTQPVQSFEQHLLLAEADAFDRGFRSGYDAEPTSMTPTTPTPVSAAPARDVAATVVPAPRRAARRRAPAPQGALAGSLLSGATWRQAWGTATGRAYSRPRDGDAA